MSQLINTSDSALLSLLDNQEELEWSAFDTFTTTPSQHLDSATLSFTEESFTNIDTSLDFLQGIENLQFSSTPQIHELFGQQQEVALDAAMEVDSNWDLDELSLLLGLSNGSTEEASATTSLLKPTSQVGHIPPREMKNPEEKEDFVHPGFYSLPTSSVATPSHSACASPFTPHALPPMPSGRKRPLRDEDLMEVVLASQHSYGHSHRQHHLAQAALANRRHSFDTAPPSSSIVSSSAGRSAMAQHLLQQQQRQPHQGTGVPPGQPFVATCSSPNGGDSFAEYLASLSQLGQIPFSPSTRAGRGMATAAFSLSSSPNGRKRRPSKYKMEAGMGGYSESFMGSSPYGSPLLGPRLVPTQASTNGHNALPPPLQQHRSQLNKSSPLPLLQHHPRPGHPPVHVKSSGTSRHGQSGSTSSSSSSSSASSSPPGGKRGGSSQQRRNPAEVSASTLPPDHFVFREAMMGLNRQSLDGGCLNLSAYTSNSSSSTGSSNHPRSTAAMHRRRSEPVISHPKGYIQKTLPSSEKGTGSGEQRSRTISPLDAFFEGTEASVQLQKRLSRGNDLPYHPLLQQQRQQQQKQAYHPYLHKLMTPPRSITSGSQSPSLPFQRTTSLVDASNGRKTASEMTSFFRGQQRDEGEAKKEGQQEEEEEEEEEEDEEDEDGAAFAQSLLMLDPITTKLMDQLRLQEYLRSEQARLPSSASAALSDQTKALNLKNAATPSIGSAETAAVAVAAALAVSPPHTPS